MWKYADIENFLSKKKNIALLYSIVIISILILSLGSCAPKEKNEQTAEMRVDLAKMLEDTLSDMAGVGDVRVAVSYETGTETVPLRSREKDSEKVVTIGSGTSAAVVKEKEIMPRVRGVIVVADGGGDADVRSRIIEAVRALTDARPHSIAVFAAK